MDVTTLLKPELMAISPVLAVTLAAVFRALEESSTSWTPPSWFRLAVVIAVSFGLGFADHAMAVEQGAVDTMLRDLWYVQGGFVLMTMLVSHKVMQSTYGTGKEPPKEDGV